MKNLYNLTKRLRNVGISQKEAKSWTRNVSKILATKGEEATIAHLKKVGDCILWALTGSGEKPTWVKTRNRYPVIFLGLEEYSEETQIRVSKIARFFVLKSVTEAQKTKVLDAVVKPYSGTTEGLQLARHLIIKGTSALTSLSCPVDLTDYPLVGRQFRRVQSVSGKTPLVQQPPVLDALKLMADMPWLKKCPEWNKVLYPLDPTWIDENLHRFQSSWPLNCVGEIHASQEGGGKLRMFASPYTTIQCLLTPSHNFFDYFRSQLPTDCTYNQQSGALEAHKRLRDKKKVHSVDLSTATCRFPWILQKDLAMFLGYPTELLEVLENVSHGFWKVGKDLRQPFERKKLRWEVGQPLGIKPSMSLFSLAHNLLLYGICIQLEVEPTETFRVLGDDVVIFDDRVHQMYLSVMQGIGVPISWQKSHSSETFAEFAGFSITRSGMYRAGQWRSVELSNALSLAEQYGSPLYGECPSSITMAQKLWLFRKGMYQPDIVNYSAYIKANSLLEGQIQKWMKSQSEYWYYAIMHVCQNSIRKYLNEPNLMVPFQYETPSPKAIHLSLSKENDDINALIKQINWRIDQCSSNAGSLVYCANEARCTIECYRDLGVITPERSTALVGEVYGKANTVLYQPPSDSVIGGSPTLKAVLAAINEVGGIN